MGLPSKTFVAQLWTATVWRLLVFACAAWTMAVAPAGAGQALSPFPDPPGYHRPVMDPENSVAKPAASSGPSGQQSSPFPDPPKPPFYRQPVSAFVADPADARLIADAALAKETVALLQSRDFNAVRGRLNPAIGLPGDDVLAGMANLIAGKARSVATISSKGTFDQATGNGESQTILEYQIDARWVLADVVIRTENEVKRVSGLHFSVNKQPLRELGLTGKGFAQYAFLAGWIGIIGLTGCAMVLAFRRHSGWRRWALMIAMPLGLGPGVAMNWSNAAFWILGGSVTSGGVTFHPVLTGNYPFAWFEMFGGPEMGAPILSVSAPLIAIGYLIWRGVGSSASSRMLTQGEQS